MEFFGGPSETGDQTQWIESSTTAECFVRGRVQPLQRMKTMSWFLC